jgi:hypothetical protein
MPYKPAKTPAYTWDPNTHKPIIALADSNANSIQKQLKQQEITDLNTQIVNDTFEQLRLTRVLAILNDLKNWVSDYHSILVYKSKKFTTNNGVKGSSVFKTAKKLNTKYSTSSFIYSKSSGYLSFDTATYFEFSDKLRVYYSTSQYYQLHHIIDLISDTSAALDTVTKKLKNADTTLHHIAKLPKPHKPHKGKGGGTTTTPPKTDSITVTRNTPQVKYNLPGINDSYFYEAPNYQTELLYIPGGNAPRRIRDAWELWRMSGSHKGMFQSFILPNGTNMTGAKNTQPEVSSQMEPNKSRYGFQFLYNPETITMSYSGAPQVDIGLEMSGKDRIPLTGAAAGASTISFTLLLNRMNDLAYLNTDEFVSKPENIVSRYPNTAADPSIDEPRTTADIIAELKQIKDMGTMYDLEFFLRTILGYAVKSKLRQFTTADVGWIGSFPVELHLGKSLRYLVTIDNINVSHTIFTADMVPVFSNVNITCKRLPDYNYDYAGQINPVVKK